MARIIISKQVLFAHKTKGGLGLPHLMRYYQAAQIAQLSAVYSRGEKPEWVAMEMAVTNKVPIDYLKWQTGKEQISHPCSYIVKLVDQVPHNPNLVSPFSPLAHLFNSGPIIFSLVAQQKVYIA